MNITHSDSIESKIYKIINKLSALYGSKCKGESVNIAHHREKNAEMVHCSDNTEQSMKHKS